MRKIAGWILVALLALLFVPIGGMKLLGVSAAVKEFETLLCGDANRHDYAVRHRNQHLIGFGQWDTHLPALARVTAVLMTLAIALAVLTRTAQQEKA